uniref:NADH dehydrogenase subunit 5 n=1 Tax=Potamyia chinensis TaxID=1875907 RepID=UPI0022388B7F|nr:NADH dehydrogenase subunit 5 [Potamyia chinensis]UYO79412.1 NADH dehydrogenase subunit 5 [Potamyia chinensis]
MYFKSNICSISMIMLFFLSMTGGVLAIVLVSLGVSYFIEIELMSINSMMIVLTFYIDWMSLCFFFVVTLISSMVIYYSKSYMAGDLFIKRFIMLILLFVFSMILLIFSLNLISLLLGWDGLGLISFCLVIYYQNVKSFNSGMLTILSNRLGDIFILMAIVWMIDSGSWNFMVYSKITSEDSYYFFLMGLIILAAMTKSAQIPFSAWLPAAMAAPTPVSALVHSSTLVTAGVYLLIRFMPLGSGESTMIKILLVISSLTMLMAGISANFEFDLKKIIALSTLSQLGLMISIFCLGFKNLAFFHLCTHAMFKSLLFMCAGMIIHNLKNNQDIRKMGGMGNFFPLVFMNLNISNLALCGMPFLAGFYSKDLILESVLFSNFNLLVFFLFFFSIGLTVSYSLRLVVMGFMSEWKLNVLMNLIDKDSVMIKSMVILMMMSIFCGSMLMWIILPDIFFIYLVGSFKFMVLFFLFLGGVLGSGILQLNTLVSYSEMMFKKIYFLSVMWFMPSLSVFGLNYSILFMSLKMDKLMDLGWFEKLGSMNLYSYLINMSKMNYFLQINFFKLFFFFFFFIISFFFLYL